jgi:hypothetical protein
MAAGNGYRAVGGEPGKMWAADADRDRVVGFLNTAYSEGWLSKDEYDARGTARKAVETLRSEGLVYTVPQRGTYVAEKRR